MVDEVFAIRIPTQGTRSARTVSETRADFSEIGGNATIGIYDNAVDENFPTRDDIQKALDGMKIGHDVMIVYAIHDNTGHHAFCLTNIEEWDYLLRPMYMKPAVVRVAPWSVVKRLIKSR